MGLPSTSFHTSPGRKSASSISLVSFGQDHHGGGYICSEKHYFKGLPRGLGCSQTGSFKCSGCSSPRTVTDLRVAMKEILWWWTSTACGGTVLWKVYRTDKPLSKPVTTKRRIRRALMVSHCLGVTRCPGATLLYFILLQLLPQKRRCLICRGLAPHVE